MHTLDWAGNVFAYQPEQLSIPAKDCFIKDTDGMRTLAAVLRQRHGSAWRGRRFSGLRNATCLT